MIWKLRIFDFMEHHSFGQINNKLFLYLKNWTLCWSMRNENSPFQIAWRNLCPPYFSDHTPSLANIEVALRVAGTWPFKFYNFLIAHPDFLTTIQEGWKVLQPETWSLSALSKKQKIFEKYLKKLHKNNYSEIQKKSRRMKSKRQTYSAGIFNQSI